MKTEINIFATEAKYNSDRLVNYFVWGYFLIGLILSGYYETWSIGFGVGGLLVVAYYSARFFMANSNLYQYTLSAATGIFMAQFIYQMHGMFEMHFFAFIGSSILVTYRNWKLQIPLAIVVLLHHSLFGYLQFSGVDSIFFTQMPYMSLETFVIHCGLTVTIFILSGLWAFKYRQSQLKHIAQSFKIATLQEADKQRKAVADLNRELLFSNGLLKQAAKELEIIFNSIQAVLFSRDLMTDRFIHISAACEQIFGYTAQQFMTDDKLWVMLVLAEDLPMSPCYSKNYGSGTNTFYKYRIEHKDKTIRWLETNMVVTTDENGLPIRIDGICNDVTNRVMLENKLAEEIQLKQREITAAVISAQEKERYFLGEELHDNINPILATAKLYVDCALSGDERATMLLQDSKQFIGDAMEEIRTLSKSLIPPTLGQIGLAQAIEGIVDNLEMVNAIKFTTIFTGIDESGLNENLQLTIFRIVQEQVTNILKHAHASKVTILIEIREGRLTLEITDDGVGFDPSQKRNGVGFRNIVSRTELCNGVVNIVAAPGKGCTLRVIFPIDHYLHAMSTGLRA